MWRMAGLAIVLSSVAGSASAAESPDAAALAAAAFATPPLHGDEAAPLANRTVFANGAPAEWRSGEVRLSNRVSGRVVDSLRISKTEPAFAEGRPVRLPGAPAQGPAYEVSLQRAWPGAVSWETPAFGLDVTPHAGVGMSSAGGLAEAGATVRLSQRLNDMARDRLQAMGVHDGRALDTQGRWYLFAAVSGQAVGLNMLHSGSGWNRAGWTTDPSSTLVGDAQAGLGWRKGSIQTSFGYVHREIKGAHMIFGQDTRPDSLVALSFSVRPRE